MLAQLEAYRTQYGIDFGYMICTNLYGPGDRFDGSTAMSCRRSSPASTAPCNSSSLNHNLGDGTPTRDFLFSDDAARAFLTVAEQGQGAFNTATGSTVTIRELVEVLRAVSRLSRQGRVGHDKAQGPAGAQL